MCSKKLRVDYGIGVADGMIVYLLVSIAVPEGTNGGSIFFRKMNIIFNGLDLFH